jgi:hypothetical protein
MGGRSHLDGRPSRPGGDVGLAAARVETVAGQQLLTVQTDAGKSGGRSLSPPMESGKAGRGNFSRFQLSQGGGF